MNISFRRLATVLVAPAALTFALTACGGGGERPSADEISESLQSGGAGELLGSTLPDLNEEAADCIGKEVYDSELSDETVKALVDGDEDYDGGGDEDKLTDVFTEVGKACAEEITASM